MADIKSRPTINVSVQSSQSITGNIRESNNSVNGNIMETLIRGYSAYEIAVQNGFTGTKEEWLASLKGETGETGPRGETGEPGKDGAPGRDGIDGINGVDGRDGLPGRDGIDGINGVDGYSPSAVVDQTANGAVITITDKTGTTTATVTNGVDGRDGRDGIDGRNGVDGVNGIDGISPQASVERINNRTVITITDASGTTTATVMDGVDGIDGKDGAAGKDGRDGVDGQPGADGADGYSPSATVEKANGIAIITITDKDGTTTATVADGKDGQTGAAGAAGADGFSPSATVTKSGNTATITITDKTGTTTATITDGQDGKDGSKGDTGADGYSPSASVTKTNGTATITITDKNGTTTATISDGQDGQPGQTGAAGSDGADGYSPTVTVTEITDGHRVAVTDKNGTQTFDVMDGQGIEETVTTDSIPYSLSGYINSSGEFTENAYTVATDFATLKNATKIEITGANTSSGAMGYAFYGSSHNFLSGVGGLTEDVTLTTFPSNAAYVRMSSRKSGYNPVAVITYTENALLSEIEEDISEIKADIDQLETVEPLSAKIFRRVGCIGDSYTAGYIDNGTTVTLSAEEYAWPYHMSKMTGQIWTNFGKSGSTTKSWMARGDYSRLGEVEAVGNKCQAYVIGLMINDSNESSPRYTPIGTAADIGTNTDSYYANYYKLIKAVNAVNAMAPIFCCTCPRTDEARFVTYNVAVRGLVDYCYGTEGLPVYLLDLADEKYNNTKYYKNPNFTQDALRGHFSPIGYEYMAECLMHVMADVINANVADFQAVHLIPYDTETLTYDKIRLMHPIETASGAVASFPDGSDLFPAEECRVSIEPVQDLHGYDNPWPAGGGKNLLPPINETLTTNGVTFTPNADESITITGTPTSGNYTYGGLYGRNSTNPAVLSPLVTGLTAGETLVLIIDGNVAGVDFIVQFNKADGTLAATRTTSSRSVTTVPNDAVYMYAAVRITTAQIETTPLNCTVRLLIANSNTALTWSPYSNICPISGWDGVNVTRAGKNLLDSSFCTNRKQNGLTTTINPDGSITLTGTASSGARYWNSVDELDLVLQPGTYTLTDGLRLTSNSGNKRGTFTITKETVYFNAFFVTTSGQTYNTTIYPQLELGSAATPYKPYTGSTISVTFPTEVGTVYGGTLDVVSGDLVVDRAMVDLGTLTWTYQSNVPRFYTSDLASVIEKAAQNDVKGNILCSIYATGIVPSATTPDKKISIATNGNVFVKDTAYTDAASFKAAMSGTQCCYGIANPIVYHLTPQEVEILLGNNTIWADAGDTEVKYRADIREYIKKARS